MRKSTCEIKVLWGCDEAEMKTFLDIEPGCRGVFGR